MFHPQEMTEVELVVPEKHILKVISYLADFGVFHQTDTSYLSSDAGWIQPKIGAPNQRHLHPSNIACYRQ